MLTWQPPLQLNSLAGTYASSAYVAAAKQGKEQLDKLAEDVTSFSKALRDSADLKAKIGTSSSLAYWGLCGMYC